MSKKSLKNLRAFNGIVSGLLITALYVSVTFCLSSCQDSILESLEDSGTDNQVEINFPQFNPTTNSPDQPDITLELFQFTDKLLKKKLTANITQGDRIAFEKENGTKIYAIYGCSVRVLEGVTEEETFVTTKVSSEGMNSAPIFFTGAEELDPDKNSLNIAMNRGVARIDVNNTDPKLKITEVTVSDAAKESYIFPAEDGVCESESISYARDFEGIRGLEKGVMTLFETAHPVTIVLKGISSGEPVELTVQTPAIKRNKVYTVSLTSDTPDETFTVRTDIIITDWEEGDDYCAGPDTANGITLDQEASTFPSNTKYDPTTGIIDVQADGTESLRLAFRSDLRIDIDNITLTGDWVEKDSLSEKGAFTIIDSTVTESGNDIITTYKVKILPQLVCRSEYIIDLGLRKASMVSVYDHLRIRVAEHPNQIQTVMMGGIEWMCFNATSQKLEDQIFPVEGATVESMYNDHYVDCVGNYFQYGKPNPFSPWTSNNPNQYADETRDIPWKTPSKMPLPEGYHVASANEWKAIMPNGIVLPSAWMTASGDSIKGTVVTLPGTLVTPSTATNNKNFKMRYVLLESVTTGNKMFIPIAGIKPNNTAEVPGHGNLGFDLRTSYWLAEDRYCWLIDYKATADNLDGATASQNRWNYDGFVLVRGVKDPK